VLELVADGQAEPDGDHHAAAAGGPARPLRAQLTDIRRVRLCAAGLLVILVGMGAWQLETSRRAAAVTTPASTPRCPTAFSSRGGTVRPAGSPATPSTAPNRPGPSETTSRRVSPSSTSPTRSYAAPMADLLEPDVVGAIE
jgi:hypothetical protein